MKLDKTNYLSAPEITKLFQLSDSALALYGVHGLLPPAADSSNPPVYGPLDQTRLKMIVRAKRANYPISRIRDLIGEFNLQQSESDRLDTSLIHCKGKYEELKNGLQDLDILEQIDISCDLELLENHIGELNKLKYRLYDLSSIGVTVIEEDSTPQSIANDTKSTPSQPQKVQNKTSRLFKPAIVCLGIIVFLSSWYLYIENKPLFGTTGIDESETKVSGSLSSTPLDEQGDMPSLSSTPTDDRWVDKLLQPTEKAPQLNDVTTLQEPKQTEDISLMPLTDVSQGQAADATETTAELLDALKKFQERESESKSTQKETSDNQFYKQLVADLQKKYATQPNIVSPGKPVSTTKKTVPLKKVKRQPETPEPQKETKPENDDISLATATSSSVSAAPQNPIAKVEKEKQASTGTLTKNNQKSEVPAKAPKTKTSLKNATKSSTLKKSSKTVVTKELTASLNPNTADSATQVPPDAAPKSALPSTDFKKLDQQIQIATISEPPVPQTKTTSTPKPGLRERPSQPTNPEALKWVQKSYESVISGNASEAIVAASVAITLDPDSVNAYINRSWAYSKKGLFDKAIQDCNKALDLDATNALAHNNRGLAFQGKGELEKAKSDYQKACRLGFKTGCNNYEEVVESLAAKK